LLHLGHIRHFEAAKQAGDKLVVTVTPDRYVNKGAGRPVFPEAQRMEAISALRCVDEVVLSEAPTAADAIRQIRPAVFAKGPDYSEATLDPGERHALAEVGGTLLITDTQKWSSTALLRQPQTGMSAEAQDYLARMRARHGAREVHGWLKQARTLRVLVIGDAIRDEYHYCDTLGKSGKDPMLVAQFVKAESFIGGAEAVSRHASACADQTEVLHGGPVTVKRRFIERYPFQKLFEVYEMNERAANDCTPLLLQTLPYQLEIVDLVIVADYGHGLLTPPVIDLICAQAKFLALNVQANAGNHGFSTISKYPRADFISLSERELRLDARDQRSDIKHLMTKRGESTLLITRGERGCVAYRPAEAFVEAPALTTHAVDRTGAGDAVFAVTACCAAVGMPLDLIGFMASVVGTQAVGIVGNARYIERASLAAAIDAVLA
jgi:cytidyltransferase-like protein